MLPEKPDMVLIGAGNVATQLGAALQKHGFSIVQVYNRTIDAASVLGERLRIPFTDRTEEIVPDAALYIFAVKDDALLTLPQTIPANSGLWIHTAGSVPMDVFKGYAERYGVLYPLQTFSRDREISFEQIPLFIEANNQADESLLCELAGNLSEEVCILSSEKRKYYHLAAVFACNFTNHMYALAADVLEQQQLDRRLLLPLIRETASKAERMNPKEAQTGPAVRYDRKVIDKQLDMLQNDPDKQEIYRLISRDIYKNSAFILSQSF